jgi:hypothetical protein
MLLVNERMLRRTLSLLSLVLIAALVYSSHCYATCGAETPASSPSSPCPYHSEKNQSSGTPCPHQYSHFFSPAAGMDLARLVDVHFGSIAGFLVVMPAVQMFNGLALFEILQKTGRHAPCGSSVFALLSMFRI